MKKILGLLLALAMLLPLTAIAEDTTENTAVAGVTANGVVESENTYDITAPFSGTLLPFTWKRGDSVKAGDALFVIDTVKVYAPTDGTLRAVFVEEGELCEDAVSQYGMIACIEKDPPQMLEASTAGAYNDPDNRLIHVGEKIYFEQTSDKDNEGEGRVTSVTGADYKVEVTAGDFDVDDAVKIYRDEKMGTKTCIGQGKVVRSADVSITAGGRVLNCAVSEGQRVKKGQLLFELAAADAAPDSKSAQVLATQDGTLDTPQVVSGQQVYKGQVLATVHDLSSMNVVAEVDEVDLGRVIIGGSLTVVLDRYPEQKISGTVRSISRMGIQKQNATYYNVKIAITTSVEVLPGMNATVWLPAVEEK